MNFQIGDKIRVKPISELKKLFKKNATKDSMGWYYTYKLSDGSNRRIYFALSMEDACEEVAKIASINREGRYTLEFEHNVFSENQDYEFIEDWLEPYLDEPVYVSSFDGEEENKSERLKAILEQIEQLAAPAEVVIPMSMHIGAPCKPVVSVGDKVTVGQLIGEPGGFVSAPIHASVSGTVKAVEPRPFSMGGTMMSVVIENDKQNTVCPDIHPVEDPDNLTPEQLVEIVKNAGIVGQGGATFPTHVKISSGLGKVDYVLINAAECEPYITGDHRTMRTA